MDIYPVYMCVKFLAYVLLFFLTLSLIVDYVRIKTHVVQSKRHYRVFFAKY